MYRYGEYCPLAKTTAVLGDYWTPLVIRELLHGREHFNDLVRSLPEISRSLLAGRLRAMERAGIVSRTIGARSQDVAYRLTPAGEDLRRVVDIMSEWGDRWSENEASLSEMHPMTTVCMLRARCSGASLPPRRVVVEISTAPPKQSRSWFVLENGIASLCETHPGFDVDIYLETDVPTLYAIWRDQLSVSQAVTRGSIRLAGNTELKRAFASWFGVIDNKLVSQAGVLLSTR